MLKLSTQFENLLTALAISIDLEKHQNEINYELEVLKEQKRLMLLERGLPYTEIKVEELDSNVSESEEFHEDNIDEIDDSHE